ncbi:MAG: HAD family phosphatase [Candidatus Magasanikbacteria bacterium]
MDTQYKAIIFDMDGLLIDSMQYWVDCDQEWFGSFGREVTPELIKFLSGRTIRENMEWMKQEFALEESVEWLMQKRNKMTESIYTQKTQPMPGVEHLVQSISTSSIKQAIASGSSKERIQTIIDRFSWNDYFDFCLSAEEVGDRGKPEPDVFLKAAKKLGVDPARCVVFEDAENGVVAAKRAGMACVAVPDKRWSVGDFSRADLIADSLEDTRLSDYIHIDI